MLNLLTLAAQSPATGDNFPVSTIVIIAAIAIILAVGLAIIGKKKK